MRSLGRLMVILLLAGCASSPVVPRRLAAIGGQSITIAQFQQYLDYALRFYRLSGAVVPSESDCRRSTVACAAFQRQILRRLLEERVVVEYAQRHHITLLHNDLRRVDAQLASLGRPGSAAAGLLAGKSVSRPFLRSLLDTEILVRKVELAVTRGRTERGPSYHLKVIAIPTTSGGSKAAAYQEAVTLATDGRPVPADATVRKEWAAPFRLGADVRVAVGIAQSGDYLGPFAQGTHFLVVRFLSSGTHRYGRLARLTEQTRLFRAWLAQKLQYAHPECFRPTGEKVACPARLD